MRCEHIPYTALLRDSSAYPQHWHVVRVVYPGSTFGRRLDGRPFIARRLRIWTILFIILILECLFSIDRAVPGAIKRDCAASYL